MISTPSKSVALSKAVIEAIVGANHGDPFTVLGMHRENPGGPVAVRAFVPGATRIQVIDADSGATIATLERLHKGGFFAGPVEGREQGYPYRLRVTTPGGTQDIEDPYRFTVVLGDTDLHLFGEGTHHRAYEKMGAHLAKFEGVSGVTFAVWAPNARRVSVVGDFNQWDGRRHTMRLRPGVGIWEIFVPGIGEGERYKYEIKSAAGEILPLKADPYGFAMEKPPHTASVVRRIDHHRWNDAGWMVTRTRRGARNAPISIYEVQLGSWKRVAEEGNRYLTYRELAEQLIPYVKAMGFTHIELLPICEYPFDGSWGYQPIGLFAPTSRFGTPEDFQYFVDCCHQAEIAVLIDWVPGHFPTDEHGLAFFDGTHLYEHADPRQGFHTDWNTLIYNFGRNEVANYLLNNALFWLKSYHIDGLRVDAVASMLYLDYSRHEGEWIPNKYGGRENLEAIDFLRRLSKLVYGEHHGVITIAEESTAWPAVSQPVYLGGLGFGYKWNMGWMHDTLQYMSRDPIYRRFHHNEMTFGLMYAFTENFVLPLSHDEVVHGKRSLLGRMPGDAWRQFANLRAYFGFMWTHPGKKLLFMGGEFAQGREWNHDAGLDWHLLDVEWHAGVHRLIRDLNRLYCSTPALYELDCQAEGFQWIDASDAENSILTFLRKGEKNTPPVVVACNLTPLARYNYRIGVPKPGFYAERLNTDAAMYGGSNVGNVGGAYSQAMAWLGQPYSMLITIPPLATVVFELE